MMIAFWAIELVIFLLIGSIVVKINFDTKKEQEARYKKLLRAARINVLREELTRSPGTRSLCNGCALRSWYVEGIDGVVPKNIQNNYRRRGTPLLEPVLDTLRAIDTYQNAIIKRNDRERTLLGDTVVIEKDKIIGEELKRMRMVSFGNTRNLTNLVLLVHCVLSLTW